MQLGNEARSLRKGENRWRRGSNLFQGAQIWNIGHEFDFLREGSTGYVRENPGKWDGPTSAGGLESR